MKCFFYLFLLSLICIQSVFAIETDWEKNAQKLTGESDRIRNAAVQNLRANVDLEKTLRLQLEATASFSRQALAFDVISALKLSSMLPDLVRFSENDANGFSYLAINSLINQSNEKKIGLSLSRPTFE